MKELCKEKRGWASRMHDEEKDGKHGDTKGLLHEITVPTITLCK